MRLVTDDREDSPRQKVLALLTADRREAEAAGDTARLREVDALIASVVSDDSSDSALIPSIITAAGAIVAAIVVGVFALAASQKGRAASSLPVASRRRSGLRRWNSRTSTRTRGEDRG